MRGQGCGCRDLLPLHLIFPPLSPSRPFSALSLFLPFCFPASVVAQFWQNIGMFAAVSNDTQHALSVMLEDDEFVDTYVAENKK